MLPLVLFIGGYLAGMAVGISGGLCGGLAFALSIVLIVFYDRRMAKQEKTIYTITGYAGDSLLRSGKKRG